MSYFKECYSKNRFCFFIVSGVIIVLLLYLPILFLGDDAVFTVLDTLDQKPPASMLNAKYFFENYVPEYMGGALKTQLYVCSPGEVFLYYFLSPRQVCTITFILTGILSFIGMFLFVNALLDNMYIALAVAITYSLIPFFPAHGLTIMGQPLVFYALILLYKNETRFLAFVLIVLFSLFSSFFFVGYVDLGILIVAIIVSAFKKRYIAFWNIR